MTAMKINPDLVREVGQRFRDHAEELNPHAEALQGIDLASAYGPWAEDAKPLEGKVRQIGDRLRNWAQYCGSYGDALHGSASEYDGKDDDEGQNLKNVDVPDRR